MNLSLTHKKFLLALANKFDTCRPAKEHLVSSKTIQDVYLFMRSYANDLANQLEADTEEISWNDIDLVEFVESKSMSKDQAHQILDSMITVISPIELMVSLLDEINTNYRSNFTGSIEDQWKLEKLLENWDKFTSADLDIIFNSKPLAV
ncbi:MAG: hypothetical protein AAFY41_00745 [Bacteroidota bacterium]